MTIAVRIVDTVPLGGLAPDAPGYDLPFVFGGDGATLLVPPSLIATVRQTLSSSQALAKQEFDLELRAGCIAVSEIRAAGYDIRIAKVRLGKVHEQAMFAGGGIKYAENQIKDLNFAALYAVTPSDNIDANYEGLECRWQDIPSRKGDPTIVAKDEHPRETSLEALAKLKGVVRPDGTVTAGNASGVNDGAAAMTLVDDEVRRSLGLPGLRVLASATAIIAGIQGAKKTADLIPLCHPLGLDDWLGALWSAARREGIAARGTAATPLLVSIRVNTITSCWPQLSSMPAAWKRSSTARSRIASYVRIVEEECFVELYCDMEQLEAEHEPRRWPDNRFSSNTWGPLPPRSYSSSSLWILIE